MISQFECRNRYKVQQSTGNH